MIRIRTAAVVFCFALMMVCAVLSSFCTNEKLLKDGFDRFSDSRFVTRHQHPLIAKAVAGYLSGRDAALGRAGLPAFSAREERHMEDVRTLVALGRGMRAGLAVPIVLAAVFAFKKGARRDILAGVALGSAWALLALLLAALWARADFEGLFALLHRVAFSNDLWLLDPNEDILIGLMPPEFFASFAKRLALYVLWMPAAAALSAVGFFRFKGKGNTDGI